MKGTNPGAGDSTPGHMGQTYEDCVPVFPRLDLGMVVMHVDLGTVVMRLDLGNVSSPVRQGEIRIGPEQLGAVSGSRSGRSFRRRIDGGDVRTRDSPPCRIPDRSQAARGRGVHDSSNGNSIRKVSPRSGLARTEIVPP